MPSSRVIKAGADKRLAYDPVRDCARITLLGPVLYVLVVHHSLPAGSVRELIVLAKSRHERLSFASASNDSGIRLATELLKSMTGIDLIHVPYRGAGPALPDLIAGQLQLMFAT